MSFDTNLFLCGLLFSSIGFVYFSYGKKQAKLEIMLCGLVLMTYPFFVTKIAWAILTGVVLTALPFIWRWW